MRSLGIFLLTQYFGGCKIKKNEMGVAYGAYGSGERCAQCSDGKPERKRTLGRPRHRWRKILRWIFGKWEGWRLDSVDSG